MCSSYPTQCLQCIIWGLVTAISSLLGVAKIMENLEICNSRTIYYRMRMNRGRRNSTNSKFRLADNNVNEIYEHICSSCILMYIKTPPASKVMIQC